MAAEYYILRQHGKNVVWDEILLIKLAFDDDSTMAGKGMKAVFNKPAY
ncbi:MAG: hypothetical protein ACTHJ5_04510 [Ilyomonas sp.]